MTTFLFLKFFYDYYRTIKYEEYLFYILNIVFIENLKITERVSSLKAYIY